MLLTAQSAVEKRLARQLAELTDRLNREVAPFADTSAAGIKSRYERTASDTDAWGRTYTPHYFDAPSAAFHDDLDAMMERRRPDGRPRRHIHVVHGPREHAKSSRCRVELMRLLLTGQVRYWLFGSEALTLAKKHVEYIYAELEGNRRIGSDYDVTILKWDSVEGVLRCRVQVRATGRVHTFQLEAVSYGRSVKGRLFMSLRPQGALLDDFENTRTARNPRISREKLQWVLQELYPAVTGPVVWLGNTGHDTSALYYAMLRCHGDDEDSLRAFLRAGTPGGILASDSDGDAASYGLERVDGPDSGDAPDADAGEGEEEPAEAQMSCYAYRADTVQEDGSVRYLWPERYTATWYAEMRATMGDALYEGEMNGWPVREGTFFKAAWFEHTYDALPDDPDGDALGWFMWTDPAFGRSTSACYKAVVVVATDRHAFYVVDAWLSQQGGVPDMIDAMYGFVEKHPTLQRGGYENDFGQEDRLRRDFSDAEARHGYPLPVAAESNRGSKAARIESLQPLAQQNRIRFPKDAPPGVKVLFSQLLAYPDGFVDGPDALESAISRCRVAASDRPMYQSLGTRRRFAHVVR